MVVDFAGDGWRTVEEKKIWGNAPSRKVAEYAKRHPIVLVPSHRSYFDFIILSLLFYDRHMLPPHIAARNASTFQESMPSRGASILPVRERPPSMKNSWVNPSLIR